jgi:anti-sigma B factor antagonist
LSDSIFAKLSPKQSQIPFNYTNSENPVISMEINLKEALEGKVIVVEIPRYLSAETSEEFKDFLYRIVDEGKYQLVLDLSKAEYVDSSGLGAIVSRIAVCRSNQGDIRLAAPSQFMVSLLKITNLDQILKVFPDVEAAVQSYQS